MMETIFALSSGLLPSGVAVIRLSGEQCVLILQHFCKKIPLPRKMTLTRLCDSNGQVIDEALVVYFPAPKSFTGEDCAEFHLHGGKALVSKFLTELSAFPHCRMAEPGEFARRAFAEGKIDLTEAEGLADLIDAETESQRRLAVMGASGELARLYRQWRNEMIRARALIEAELDFSDESDVPGSVSQSVWAGVKLLQKDIDMHISAGERAGAMRDGLKIVIAGVPNSGKSSIINKLVGRSVAIVTEEAGTTRDALEVRLEIAGMPVLITDTAGLRKTDNKVEKIGIERAYERIEEADLVLQLEDMGDPQTVTLPSTRAEIWHIGNKCDLIQGDKARWPIQVSAKTGQGFDIFLEKLTNFCAAHSVKIGEAVPARRRQIDLLKQASHELGLALREREDQLELRAEHLRLASNALGRITGDVDVEDLLDVIFSQFCIGK